MKISKLIQAATLSAGLLGAAGANAQLSLPSSGYYQYGDFQSYSLPILAYFYDQANGGGVGPGNPYYIPSAPGNIQDQIVIYTGSGGTGINDNLAPPIAGSGSIDGAYAAPNGVQIPYFSTATSPDPNPTFTGDQANTWDISLGKLQTFLGNNADNLVFLFNNNDTNADQTLAIWGRIWITNSAGTNLGTFCLSNMGGTYGSGGIPNGTVAYSCNGTAEGAGNPLVNPQTQKTDYILSGGQVCILPDGTPVDCSNPNAIRFNHNLGANQVAYAATSTDLNVLLASLFGGNVDGLTMHVDLHLGCDAQWDPTAAASNNPDKALADSANCVSKKIDNGYEQLFIASLASPPVCTVGVDCPTAPEPGSIALIGLGLFGLAASRKWSTQKAAV